MPTRNFLHFIISLLATSLLTIGNCHAGETSNEYKLAIQPILPQETLKANFQPLADYLSAETGHKITITTQRNFLFYWTKMRKHKRGFDLVLDAAHLTDYRSKKLGYTVLAKMPGTVSYTVVTRSDRLIFGSEDLIGLRVATMHSPSLGSLRLEQIFPNPMRMPHYVWKRNTTVAINDIASGKVDAAIIPTRLVSNYENLNIVLSTAPVPHMALSAAPEVPVEVAEKIRSALVNADQTKTGRAMLRKLKLDNFEAASNADYDGYAELLKNEFGFSLSSEMQSSDTQPSEKQPPEIH